MVLFSYFDFNQIWLNCPMDDHNELCPHYKIEKKKKTPIPDGLIDSNFQQRSSMYSSGL
jgi:hypothetical protein